MTVARQGIKTARDVPQGATHFYRICHSDEFLSPDRVVSLR